MIFMMFLIWEMFLSSIKSKYLGICEFVKIKSILDHVMSDPNL